MSVVRRATEELAQIFTRQLSPVGEGAADPVSFASEAMDLDEEQLVALVGHMQELHDELLRYSGRILALSAITHTGILGEDTRQWMMMAREYSTHLQKALLSAVTDVESLEFPSQ